MFVEMASRLNSDQKEGYEKIKKMKQIKHFAKICSKDVKVLGLTPNEFKAIFRYKYDSNCDREFLLRHLGLPNQE